MLLDQFGTEAETLPWANAQELGVTPYEVVTIASMIEREAALDRERPIIAGVIYNRLKIGMNLGIDATLLYDDPTPDGQLSFSDLEYDSPYNTRLNPGLPPTPIASPGRASLEAATEPGRHALPLLRAVRRGRASRVRQDRGRARSQPDPLR